MPAATHATRRADVFHYRVEVDQSNKIEETNRDTIIAFSNSLFSSVLIPAHVKRELIREVKARRRDETTSRIARRIFAAGLFLLLRDHLDALDVIVIDTEYSGHDQDLQAMLLRHIWQIRPDYNKDRLEWMQVGKRSPAHALARKVAQGKQYADRVVTIEELRRLVH